MENNVAVEPKKRGKPGTQRIMVTLSQEHCEKLSALAKAESPICPRTTAEFLSNLLHNRFTTLVDQGQ